MGKVCTLPIIIDSLDSITKLLRHWVRSLQSATVLSQRLPLVTFIWRDVMPDASRGSLNLFPKNLMPVGLASIATHCLLNQCSASSARQHSKCNSKCLQLKKWMNDPEFQTGPVFCLFNFNVSDWVSRANHGSVYPAVSLHGIFLDAWWESFLASLPLSVIDVHNVLSLSPERPGRKTQKLLQMEAADIRSW